MDSTRSVLQTILFCSREVEVYLLRGFLILTHSYLRIYGVHGAMNRSRSRAK